MWHVDCSSINKAYYLLPSCTQIHAIYNLVAHDSMLVNISIFGKSLAFCTAIMKSSSQEKKSFAASVSLGKKTDEFRSIRMKKMNGKERRMYPRLRVRWAVSIQAADGLRQGEMENISLGGAFIRCDKPPLPNEKVLLTYKDHSHNMKVLAQVAWTNRPSASGGDKPTGIGVKFLQFLGTPKPAESPES